MPRSSLIFRQRIEVLLVQGLRYTSLNLQDFIPAVQSCKLFYVLRARPTVCTTFH